MVHLLEKTGKVAIATKDYPSTPLRMTSHWAESKCYQYWNYSSSYLIKDHFIRF